MALLNSDEQRQKGREIAGQLFGGAQRPAAAPDAPAPINPDFQAMLREWMFGGVWSRPGLDIQQRSMVALAVLAAQGLEPHLHTNIMAARRLGLSEEQIEEILIQVGMYAGLPRSVTALRIAREAFAQFTAASAPASAAQS